MNEEILYDDKSATEYLLRWMESIKKEWTHNPEGFIKSEPGIYIGGVRLQPGDTIINDNHGFPTILREGACG